MPPGVLICEFKRRAAAGHVAKYFFATKVKQIFPCLNYVSVRQGFEISLRQDDVLDAIHFLGQCLYKLLSLECDFPCAIRAKSLATGISNFSGTLAALAHQPTFFDATPLKVAEPTFVPALANLFCIDLLQFGQN